MRRYLSIIFISSSIIFYAAGLLWGDDINFEVSINRTSILLGSDAQLSLNFHGTQNVAAPQLPDIEGFDCRYIGPSSRMSIVNGRISTSITHIYNLYAVKEGTFTIPVISVEYDGKTYTSEPIRVEVTKGAVSRQPAPVGSSSESQSDIQGLSDRIFLVTQVDKKKACVNEIIPVTIKLFINNLAARDIQYPEFDHEGFMVEEFAQPKQYKSVLNGILYDVIEFNTNISGMHPGELTLGPTQLKCNLVFKRSRGKRLPSMFDDDDFFGSDIFSDFFGSYDKRSITLISTAFPVQVMALPEEGRPPGFNGALGDYSFDVTVSQSEVKVGDPVTLTMRVRGDGNLKTVSAPALDFNENDFKVYEPQVTQDSRSKVFEQVIIPKNEDITEIPAIAFSFFDAKAGEYKTITEGPTPIKVNPLPAGEELKVFELAGDIPAVARRREELGRDIIFIKDRLEGLRRRGLFLYKNKLFLLGLFLPPICVLSVLLIHLRRQKLATDIGYARRLRAPGAAKRNLARARGLLSGEAGDFFGAVFKTLQEYLGDRFHMPAAGITSSIVEDPRLARIDKEILSDISRCFNACDRVRYAPSSITKDEMEETFELVRKVIDRLERVKR